MFDTMTFTKIMGGFCGALLVFLLGKWAAEEIYAMGGHGDDHGPAYVIDTGSDDEAPAEEEEVVTLASLYADADPEAGARVFNKCSACHKVEDGANGVGPHLYGVVNRDIGSVDSYAAYSGALSEAADVWTAENLYAFLENPSGWAPGTSMGYAGLKKPEDRANVIAYLDMTDGDMVELAAAEAPAAAEEAVMEEASSEEAPAEEAAMEEASAEEAATEEAAAEDAAPVEEEMAAAEESATEEAAAAEPAAEASGFAAMVAAADAADGERVYRQCAACHVVDDEVNRVGPHLYGVVGRDIGSVEGYNYSDATASHGGVWDVDSLNAWLENSNDFIPGNKMSYRGLSDEEDRAAVIKYMQSVAE